MGQHLKHLILLLVAVNHYLYAPYAGNNLTEKNKIFNFGIQTILRSFLRNARMEVPTCKFQNASETSHSLGSLYLYLYNTE